MRRVLLLAVALVCACGGNSSSNDVVDDALPVDSLADLTGDLLADGTAVDMEVEPDQTVDLAVDLPKEDTGGPVEEGYVAVPLSAQMDLNSVWGWGDVLVAVGDDGAIFRRQGQSWTPMLSPTDKDLMAVFGEAADDVYAVGSAGTIIHFDGALWSDVDTGLDAFDNLTFRGAWGEDGHLFVVGGDGVILHKAGPQWGQEDTLTTNDLSAVWGSSLVDVYVAASGGNMLRRIGGAWSSEQLSSASVELTCVHGYDNKSVFSGGTKGVLLVLESGAWVPKLSNDVQERNLHSLWSFGEEDIWFIGADGILVHSEGGKWSMADVAGPYFKNHSFYGLWGREDAEGARQAWAVGATGAALHFDGEQWSDEVAGPMADIADVAGAGSTAVAVGQDGLVLTWDGGRWAGLDRVTELNMTSVTGWDGGFLAVGDPGVLVRIADGEVTLDSTGLDSRLEGICTDGSQLAAVGEKGGLYVSDDGESWEKISTGVFDTLRDCAYLAGSKILAVGDKGTALESKGGAANDLALSTLADLNRVAVAADGTVYVVGANGLILRSNGAGFDKIHEEPGLFLYGVEAFEDRVVAAGWAGKIVTWFPDTEEATTEALEGAGVLLQVWGNSGTDHFVVGKKGTMLRYAGE